MALVKGTNCGFVTVAPTVDPAGTASQVIDTVSRAFRDTAPAGAIKITEIGWYCVGASEETNFEVGLYSDDSGSGVPLNRLFVDTTNAKGTGLGWKTVTVDWEITSGTVYWLGVQVDNTANPTVIDRTASGGDAQSFMLTQTSLANPWLSGGVQAYLYAIYAVYELAAATVVLYMEGDNNSRVTINVPSSVWQRQDASLDSIAALTYASDSFIKVTAEDTYAIRTIAETKTDLSLNLVENTAHSTDAHTMTIDGRDVSVDGTKLDGIEALADVTATAETSHADVVVDGDFASNGILNRTGAGSYSILALGTDVQAYHANLAAIAGGTWTGAASITTLGTIGTGTWQATDVGIGYGGTGQSTAQLAINALSAVGAATNEHVLTKDTGTGNAIWKAAAGGGGKVVQVVNVQTGAVNTGATVLPLNDNIPQKTEGNEFMTLAITPTNASNKLKIEAVIQLASSSAGAQGLSIALFQDATANALAANYLVGTAANYSYELVTTHYMTAGTTSETTFKIHGGAHAAATVTFNGTAAGRIFGGVIASSITITEIEV
jgi:hypothetical protein